MERNEDGTLGPQHITDEGIELRGGTMNLREALEALYARIGNDPDCDCDDCSLGRQIQAQLVEIQPDDA